MWSLILFVALLIGGVTLLVRGIRGGQKERKQLLRAIIFLVGTLLFVIALTPKFFPNHYDSGHVSGPAVLLTDDGYRMYFTGHTLATGTGRTGAASIGIAESSDGVLWTKRQGGPVVGRSLLSFSDSYGVMEPAIVKKGDTYYMYYITKSYLGDTAIGLATSTDGLSWHKRRTPVLTPERPIPTAEEIETWDDDQVKEFLASRGYKDDFFKIDKRLWLSNVLSIAQRLDDPGFYPNVRIASLAIAKYVLKRDKAPKELSIAPDTTVEDLPALKEKIDAFLQSKNVEPPNWAALTVMKDEEVDLLFASLGLSETILEIPKKEYLLRVANILERKIHWADALRYLKVTGDAPAGATHLDFYGIYRDLKEKLAHGLDDNGFGDLSVIYDEAADEFRMWYVAKGFMGNVLVYATSKDGIEWQRASWNDLENLRSLGAISAASVIPEGTAYRAAFITGEKISLAYSPDGVTGWTIDRPGILTQAERPKFDSKGFVSVALHKADGKYLLWYAGQAKDSDKPLPTLGELEEMSNKGLFNLAEILDFRMSWNREECRRFLSYAHDFIDKGSEYEEIPGTGLVRVTRKGAIFSYPDDLVREIALRYKIDIEVIQKSNLADVERRDVIWSLRKTLLQRCIVKEGRSLEYPGLDEIDQWDFEKLIEMSRRYGIPELPDSPEELTAEEQETLLEPLREGLRRFSRLCKGKRAYLDSISDERLVDIASDYNVVVELGRPRHALKRNIERLNPDLLRMEIERDVSKRFQVYLKEQPIVTRIGLATSDDGLHWTKLDGAQAFEAVLDARGRFEKARNPLQAAFEQKFANYAVILGWLSVFLGTVNLWKHHGTVILRKRKDWIYSLTFFLTFFFMLTMFIIYYPRTAEFVRAPNPVHFSDNFIANPIIASIVALLGYYITSAAYRAFRVKNVEATIMMIVAVFVMLGNVPVFEPLTRDTLLHTIFDQFHFPNLRDWIMSTGNTAVFRALNFGLALGIVAMSIRILLGIERGPFFEKL